MHRPAAPRHDNSPSAPGQPRLREVEQQLRAVLDASLAAVVFLDRDGYVLDCNEPYAARFGLSRDEILNTCVWGRHPEDVERRRRALMAEVFNTGTPILREDKRDSIWNRYRIAPATWTSEGEVSSVVVEALDITEFKHRENRLRETEERLRISFDTDLVAMAVSRRRDGMYLEATPGFLKISGYSREEVVGHTSCELKFFSDPQRRAMLEDLDEEGRLHNREMTFPRKDGELRTILFSIGPISVAGEDCLLATMVDITEQKTVERMLRESEIRFRELAELLPEVVFEADQDNRLTFANRKAFEVFGYSPEDMVSGLDGFGMIHPDDRQRARKNFQRRIRGSKIGLNEYTGLRKDGSTFPMLLHTDPIMRGGKPQGIRGVLIDITERKKAEAEFADNRTRLALALEGANLGTWDWHIPSGKAVFSDLWAVTKGYELSELKPHISTWENLVHPDDLPDVRKRLAEHLDGTTTLYEATFRMRHKSGKWIWIADKGKVIERNPDGTPVRACGINQDITETKKLNERLRQAEKMESIGTLAGGIAHDFNNILGAVIGYADMSLADVPPGSRLETNLRRILQGGTRAGKLVNQILNFSRRAADEKSPQFLRPVIREVVEMMRASLPSTIEIKSSLARDSQPVLADPTRIHEIVMNLCTNAAQAMEDEKGLLEVRYEETVLDEEIEGRAGTVPPGGYSVITVRDNGRGMDEETLERVFEPFFTTKPLGRGTGMGMAVLFGIVQEHSGTVTVESTLGTGTTFRVYLPKCDDTREADTGKQHTTMVPGGTERIMVVDDEDIMIEMAKDMLSELGYSVTALNDPVRALDTFRNNPNSFDLLVTDQTMPALPGMELAREARRIRPDLPIILCTGYSTLVDEEKALATGIDGFLTKPFRQRVIAYKIRFVLREKAAS